MSETLQDLAAKVDSIPWVQFAQPDWNKEDSVSKALRDLIFCSDEKSSTTAYHGVLFALGNNHGGTYYPAALPAIPLLGKLIAAGSFWPRETTLSILLDYMLSFQADPQMNASGKTNLIPTELDVLMKTEIAKLRPVLEAYISECQENGRAMDCVVDLLEAIDQQREAA